MFGFDAAGLGFLRLLGCRDSGFGMQRLSRPDGKGWPSFTPLVQKTLLAFLEILLVVKCYSFHPNLVSDKTQGRGGPREGRRGRPDSASRASSEEHASYMITIINMFIIIMIVIINNSISIKLILISDELSGPR